MNCEDLKERPNENERADDERQRILAQMKNGLKRHCIPIQARNHQGTMTSPENHTLQTSLHMFCTKAEKLQEPTQYFMMDKMWQRVFQLFIMCKCRVERQFKF